jgi:hypothetical protein
LDKIVVTLQIKMQFAGDRRVSVGNIATVVKAGRRGRRSSKRMEIGW